jgi:hypothetical protein
MNRKEFNKFVFTLIITAGAAVLMIGSFNLVSDPFNMFGLWTEEGVNAFKPSIYNRVRLLKAYEIRRNMPDSILLGTSRSHLGFSPDNPSWAKVASRPYNAAFDGATTKEMYYYLRHAQAVRPLKHVILGLDTYHPTKVPASQKPDFDRSLLLKDNSLISKIKLFLTDLRLLTSFETLMESIETLKVQDKENYRWLSPDGQRLGEVFFRRPYENFQKFGARYYFDEIDKNEVGYKLEWKVPAPVRPKIYPPPAPIKPDQWTSIDYIQKIIDFCRAKHIQLHIVITPSHVHQLELDDATGAWWSVENAKKMMVEMVAKSNLGLAQK